MQDTAGVFAVMEQPGYHAGACVRFHRRRGRPRRRPFHRPRRPTGCTVVLTPQGAVCGVDVRGAAPGTRETELLSPLNAVEQVHAVLLAGGSAFGLDAAGGVMRWLDERGIGVAVGPVRVPIVPAAILFDLWIGDARIRPDAEAGYAACRPPAAAAGAGQRRRRAGASVGKLYGMARAMKGGIGSASVRVGASPSARWWR